MKTVFAVLLMALLALPLASVANAGGGAGPSKDMMKGKFTSIDAAAQTAVFVKDVTGETKELTFGEFVKADDLRVGKKMIVTLDHESGQIKEASIMFMDMTLGKVLALLMVGLIGGLLSGFIGSGGAFVLTPAMMSLGAPGAIAVASNMCHKFPKAMVGAFKRYKYGQVDLKLGLVMAASAIAGVQIGIKIQKMILNTWGNAGSNLYVSLCFVVILVVVGAYVFYDAYKMSKGIASDVHQVSKLSLALQKIKIPPMMHFKTAGVTMSAWITLPIGLLTGMLAATIAVGGFVGVPGMIYVVGASAMVASATELVVAFIMGMWGSIQWGLSGLIDIRLTLLILAASLFGVQLGALGTTYVKDTTIKVVMGSVMLIVAVSRGAKVPVYLADVGAISPVNPGVAAVLEQVSFWALIAALATAGIIITGAMVKGIAQAKAEKAAAAEAVSHG